MRRTLIILTAGATFALVGFIFLYKALTESNVTNNGRKAYALAGSALLAGGLWSCKVGVLGTTEQRVAVAQH